MGMVQRKKLHTVLASLMVISLLGCAKQAATPTEPTPAETAPAQTQAAATEAAVIPETSPLEHVEDLTIVVTEADISQLEDYPHLKRLDLTGSTCYDAIADYIKAHPQVEVTYTVSIGETLIRNTDAEATLAAGTYDYLAIANQLPYLPDLATLRLPKTHLLSYEMAALLENFPAVEFAYTVELLGQEYDRTTTELNLSAIRPEQVEETAVPLGLLFQLESVELMTSGNQSRLDKADVKVLVDAVPHANFHYTFSYLGRKLSTTDERVEFKNYNIGDKGETELRAVLDIMTGCSYFKLDNCKLSNTVLDTLRDDYRDKGIKIVWRVYFGQYGKYNALTDTEVIRAVYNVYDSNVDPLHYCEDVKYIDMGHNDYLTNLSFVGNMPNLEILIASGCGVKDLSGIENCKKLEFLELAYCGYLKDISPLSGCEGLKYLNLSYTKVSELLALDGLPLESFICKKSHVPPAEQEIFMAIHPDCWTQFLGSQPYGTGWRYEDNGITYTEIYRKIRDIFHYDDMPVE